MNDILRYSLANRERQRKRERDIEDWRLHVNKLLGIENNWAAHLYERHSGWAVTQIVGGTQCTWPSKPCALQVTLSSMQLLG